METEQSLRAAPFSVGHTLCRKDGTRNQSERCHIYALITRFLVLEPHAIMESELVTRFLALGLFFALGLPTSALAKDAYCEINAERIIITEGPCKFKPLGNGDFFFAMKDGSGAASATNVKNAEYSKGAYWYRDETGDLFPVAMGTLYPPDGPHSRPGCWGNRSYEICAW